MLNANRETQQPVVYTNRIADLHRNVCMSLHSRIGHQRLHPAEAFGEGNQTDVAEQRLDVSGIFYLEGEDPGVA
ncbi:hypothetical protein D3C75_1122400 [compost metagenome]